MNNSFRSFGRFLLVLCGSTLSLLRAQDPTPEPPPKPPFVAELPGNFHAMLSFDRKLKAGSYDSSKEASEVFPKEIDIVKVGNIQKQTFSWSNTTSTSVWYKQAHQLFQDPVSKTVSVFGAEDPKLLWEDVFPCWGFYATSWINAKHFKETIKLGDTKCHHYQEGERPYAEDGMTRLPVREAWIDAETRLPVAVRSDGGAVRYKYLEVPTASISLPPEFQKAWEDYQTQMVRLESMRMK